jgi:hypothetical protein
MPHGPATFKTARHPSQEDKDSGVFSENGRKVPFWLAQVGGYQVLEMLAAGEIWTRNQPQRFVCIWFWSRES